MKIYNRPAFTFGVFCAGMLLLFALGVIPADWWQWALAVVLSVRYLYIGLKSDGGAAEAVHRDYHETAVKLYGKYALLKINLPIFLLAVFFGAGLFVRLTFDVAVPGGIGIVFCVLLTISVLYSVGLDRTIRSAIEAEKNDSQ